MDPYYYHYWHTYIYVSQITSQAYQQESSRLFLQQRIKTENLQQTPQRKNAQIFTCHLPCLTINSAGYKIGPKISSVDQMEKITKVRSTSQINKSQLGPIQTIQSKFTEKRNDVMQRQSRNANSNLLRMFFRRFQALIQEKPKILDYITQKNKINIKKESFKEWFQINKVDNSKYVRVPSCKVLFYGKKNDQNFTKIMRIFLKNYLTKEAHCHFLTSKKIKKSLMPQNNNAIRHILKDIQNAKNC